LKYGIGPTGSIKTEGGRFLGWMSYYQFLKNDPASVRASIRIMWVDDETSGGLIRFSEPRQQVTTLALPGLPEKCGET
jgi:hypothetical protein